MYSKRVDIGEKLSILAASARYDASCASSGSERRSKGRGRFGSANPAGVCHSWTGDGRCVSLLKLLYSNACRFDCAYCANRCSVDVRRASFTPDELVRLTVSFYRRNYIEGLFLSSGIFADPDIVMERLIDVARRLRIEAGFDGYIHLKAIPGAEEGSLSEAARWADRISANIELPTESSLHCLAPQKNGKSIIQAMRFLRDGILERKEAGKSGSSFCSSIPAFAPAGQSTQVVVGASPEPDGSILRLADSLYRKMGLRRVYYSAYVPVSPDTRLPRNDPPLKREHRLYQADWLLRFYHFSVDEICPSTGNLSLEYDPKVAWATAHPEFFPIELSSADYEAILRVPGIGVTGARRILDARRASDIGFHSLSRLGIVMKRARHFITLRGRRMELAMDPGPKLNETLRLGMPGVEDDVNAAASFAMPSPAVPQIEFDFDA
jgi:putative DNA modification/repair radical SAM protein